MITTINEWKQYLKLNENSSNESTNYEELFTNAFGKHVGLNTDWNVKAWHVLGKYFIVDHEDGTYSITIKNGNDGDEDDVVNIFTNSDPNVILQEVEKLKVDGIIKESRNVKGKLMKGNFVTNTENNKKGQITKVTHIGPNKERDTVYPWITIKYDDGTEGTVKLKMDNDFKRNIESDYQRKEK